MFLFFYGIMPVSLLFQIHFNFFKVSAGESWKCVCESMWWLIPVHVFSVWEAAESFVKLWKMKVTCIQACDWPVSKRGLLLLSVWHRKSPHHPRHHPSCTDGKRCKKQNDKYESEISVVKQWHFIFFQLSLCWCWLSWCKYVKCSTELCDFALHVHACHLLGSRHYCR